MTDVTIFNTNTLGLALSVNNGALFQIAGASPGGPPQTAPSGGPSWSNTMPAPNVLAPGDNFLMLMPSGVAQPYNTIVSLPGDMQWTSLQLYIFFNSYSDVSWVVLNQGQFVTANLKLGAVRALDADAPIRPA